jgi:hypothetical protein
MLMRFSNYSTDADHLHPLSCIVAPGAWASDVRDGVCGDRPGLVGVAAPGDRRTIVLAPFPQAGTRVDFEPNDPISQPLGADVWQPTGVRIRHHQGYPGIIGDASFSSYNTGKTQVQAALEVNAATQGKLDEVLARQKDGRPPYGAAILVRAATGTGLEVRGPVEQAAIDLWQYDGNLKPIQWRLPSRVARVHVDPQTADFVFSGGNLDVRGQGLVRQGGVSATTTPAHNLRGIGVAVAGGAKRLAVRFDQPEADPAYSLVVQANWFTLDRVTEKRADGFVVEFSEPAPQGSTLDWQLVR